MKNTESILASYRTISNSGKHFLSNLHQIKITELYYYHENRGTFIVYYMKTNSFQRHKLIIQELSNRYLYYVSIQLENHLFLIGGKKHDDIIAHVHSITYCDSSVTYSQKAPLLLPRYCHSGCTAGRHILTNGSLDDTASNTAELYDIVADI